MKFIREDIDSSDAPSFKEWLYGPPSSLTPPVDPHDDTCYGPCCVEYWEEDEDDDLFDF